MDINLKEEIKTYKKAVYISHAYNNKKENKIRIENIAKYLTNKFPDIIFYSPVHTFGFLYSEVSYNDGLRMCLDLLNKCDEMWLFDSYEDSTGCNCELAYCINQNIPYKIFKTGKCHKKNTTDYEDCLSCEFVYVDKIGVHCNIKKFKREIDKEVKYGSKQSR